jgi:diazepam-binding inhibitor (GABA receptor modulating acyl-CoA-binding protein)
MSEWKTKFELATKYVKNGYGKEQYKDSTKELTNEEQLKMYAYFKRVTVGKCSEKGGERPGFFSFEAKAKWDAWSAVDSCSEEDAQKEYCKLLTEMAPEWEKFPKLSQ